MTAGTGSDSAAYARHCHPECIACRDRGDGGLGLEFRSDADGGVEAEFSCGSFYQSYPDRLHGGIAALLLDAAMTHCFFARGLCGLTARLNIRYRGKVEIDVAGLVRARIRRSVHGLHDLEAELLQSGVVKAAAEGRFASRPDFEGGQV